MTSQINQLSDAELGSSYTTVREMSRTTRNEREGVAGRRERQTFTLYARARDERIHFVSESSSGGGVVSAVNVLVSPPPAFTHGL